MARSHAHELVLAPTPTLQLPLVYIPRLEVHLEIMAPDEKSPKATDTNGGSTSDIGSLEDVIRDIDSGEINELAVVAEGEEKTTWFVWILVTCSTISGLLFGVSFRFDVAAQSS